MKKITITMVLSIVTATSILAQWGHGSSSTTVYYQDNVPTHYDDNYYDDYRRGQSPFRTYRRVEHVYNRMSRRDRKRLKGLERKLRDRKRNAWEDGYISDRDLRKVRKVENEISELYAKYSYYGSQRRNYRNNGDYRNNRYSYNYNRNYRGCR